MTGPTWLIQSTTGATSHLPQQKAAGWDAYRVLGTHSFLAHYPAGAHADLNS